MSAFNVTQYNLALFNIQKGSSVWFEGNSFVSFDFSFAGETFYCKGNSKVQINVTDLQLDSGRVFEGSSQINFSSDVINIIGHFNLIAKFKEEFLWDSDSYVSQRAYAKGTSTEKFTPYVNLSQEAYCDGQSITAVYTTKINVSKSVYALADFGEVFLGILDVMILEEFTCEFPGLTLKPGDTLIIDSGLYNVLLNDQNAIHYQNGDWIDNLSRDTQELLVTGSGASRLSIEILYTERFL